MLFSGADLQKEIRVILDQNAVSSQLIAADDIDTLTLDQIIIGAIPNAARLVENDAPVYLLDGGKDFGGSVGWVSGVGEGAGHIHLPGDFLRLVSFQMSDWNRAVSVAITDDHPLYPMQSSRYPGIRGNPQHPIVAIVTHPVGQVLEFYSCTGGETVSVKRARYIAIPAFDTNGFINLCEKLKPAIVYYAAYLVCLTMGQAELGATFLNVSKELSR